MRHSIPLSTVTVLCGALLTSVAFAQSPSSQHQSQRSAASMFSNPWGKPTAADITKAKRQEQIRLAMLRAWDNLPLKQRDKIVAQFSAMTEAQRLELLNKTPALKNLTVEQKSMLLDKIAKVVPYPPPPESSIPAVTNFCVRITSAGDAPMTDPVWISRGIDEGVNYRSINLQIYGYQYNTAGSTGPSAFKYNETKVDSPFEARTHLSDYYSVVVVSGQSTTITVSVRGALNDPAQNGMSGTEFSAPLTMTYVMPPSPYARPPGQSVDTPLNVNPQCVK